MTLQLGQVKEGTGIPGKVCPVVRVPRWPALPGACRELGDLGMSGLWERSRARVGDMTGTSSGKSVPPARGLGPTRRH